MNIGIDIDDTISDTYATCFPYAQKFTIEELGREGTININETQKTHKYCGGLHKWTLEEDEAFWNKYYKEMMEKIKIKEFAKEYIKKLAESNNIYIITARWDFGDGTIERIKKKWLEENEIPYDKLIINSQEKGKMAKELELDIFIDDSIKNCIDVSNLGVKTLIMDSKVNGEFKDEKITRVYSWPHVYQEIEKYAKGE